jgi:hypothetical protein
MTLGNLDWWKENSDWLHRNAKLLKLTPQQWRMEGEPMKSDTSPNKDKPKNDLDWICICRPEWDYRLQKEEESSEEDQREADIVAESVDDEDDPHACGK